MEYPDIAYPEVVSYTENGDGTVTLHINAVYPPCTFHPKAKSEASYVPVCRLMSIYNFHLKSSSHRQPVPYMADENLGVGAVYQVPEELFEDVIGAYFNMDRETSLNGRITVMCENSLDIFPLGYTALI